MTIGQVISDIKTDLKLLNADARVTNRMVWGAIQAHMRWLIARESKRTGLHGLSYLYQTLKCVSIDEVSASDESCDVFKSKCKVYRTREKIPRLYEDDDGVLIRAVYTTDGSLEYISTTLSEYARKLENPHNKYNKNKYFYYNNGYLYFPEGGARVVQVKGYFEEEISSYCDPSVRCLSKLDTEFRFPSKLIGELKSYVLKDLSVPRQIPDDQQINKKPEP